MMAGERLELASTQVAVTYTFRSASGSLGWANCTIVDATGELLITSDWGSWSHCWSPSPANLGAPTLTAFLADHGSVDYVARKLQKEGTAAREWSGERTAAALRRRLCAVRLEHGRERLEARLDPEDMPGGHRYDDDGLPIYSHVMPAGYQSGRPWRPDGTAYEPLPYLTRDAARRIWNDIGELADECCRSSELFFERIWHIDGLADYVTEEPWNYSATEQTTGDRALREIVLPALIEACRARAAEPPPSHPPAQPTHEAPP